jgi:hypothetical protein
MKSESLNLLELSGHIQTCTEIALPFFCSAVICIPNAPSLRFGLEARYPSLNFHDLSQHIEANKGTVE